MRNPAEAEPRARVLAGTMAVLLEASLLVRHAPPEVSDAFCASRLGSHASLVFGGLPRSLHFDKIIARSTPIA
jgi:putative acyl-CoA dehydrogenase